MQRQKTIFITVYDGDIEKNFLRSGVLEQLKRAGMKTILLVRAAQGTARHKYYVENFGAEDVIIEPTPTAMSTAERYWYHLSWNTLPTRSSYVKRHDLYLRHRSFIRYALEQITWLLGHLYIWRQLIRFAYLKIPDSYGDDLFKKYQPDLLFAPNMFSAEDCRLLKAARRHRVPSLTTAKSWDVPTTRGFTRVIADRILVFNEINAREVVAIGDYKPTRVFSVGFPQFDFYTNTATYSSRESFISSIGGDPAKRLILFAVPGDFKNPFSDEILELLDEAVENNKFCVPVQVLARFHPKYPSRAEHLLSLRHIIKDRPGTYFAKKLEKAIDAPQESTFQWTFTNDDLMHLANSIHHSDVTINTESTMTLDAASQDKPVVLIGFDGKRKLSYWESIIRNYSREHLQAVLQTEGVRLAESMDELVEHVNRYLSDPDADKKGRERLRQELLMGNDGNAANRISDHILEMAGI